MMNDSTLQDMVMAELEWEPSIDAAHIGVTAKNGVVTLSGFVDSYMAKAVAERAASRVQGVKAIAEEIEVRLPNAQKHADDEIAERALRILAWDVQVPDQTLQVKVDHGLVTLTGDVSFQFQRTAAENAIRRLNGVREVRDLIRVLPPRNPPADPELVRQRIESALQRSAAVEASLVGVAVSDGTVTLKGKVSSWLERNVVEDAAWAAPGVSQVRNQLAVQL